MIKNESQLTRAKQEMEELLDALYQIKGEELTDRMQKAAYCCRLKDLSSEIEEFEKLRNRQHLSFTNENLPKSIIALRIASGYTQKELADKIGVPEQQIQRYEQQEYGKVKFERVVQIIRVLAKKCELNFQLSAPGQIPAPFKQTEESARATRIAKERASLMLII